MSTKKIRLNLQIDEKTLNMTKVLREKYHINVSSMVRESIVNAYEKVVKKCGSRKIG